MQVEDDEDYNVADDAEEQVDRRRRRNYNNR